MERAPERTNNRIGATLPWDNTDIALATQRADGTRAAPVWPAKYLGIKRATGSMKKRGNVPRPVA
eukprot:2446920-Lingulodinium_polyedra.AAC.1